MTTQGITIAVRPLIIRGPGRRRSSVGEIRISKKNSPSKKSLPTGYRKEEEDFGQARIETVSTRH